MSVDDSETVALLRQIAFSLDQLLARAPAAANSSEEVLLTVAEAAALLKTTPKAIYVMKERGQIPAQKRGTRLLFRKADLLGSLVEVRAVSSDGRHRR